MRDLGILYNILWLIQNLSKRPQAGGHWYLGLVFVTLSWSCGAEYCKLKRQTSTDNTLNSESTPWQSLELRTCKERQRYCRNLQKPKVRICQNHEGNPSWTSFIFIQPMRLGDTVFTRIYSSSIDCKVDYGKSFAKWISMPNQTVSLKPSRVALPDGVPAGLVAIVSSLRSGKAPYTVNAMSISHAKLHHSESRWRKKKTNSDGRWRSQAVKSLFLADGVTPKSIAIFGK